MKTEYDFSNGTRGKFYRGNKPAQIVVTVPESLRHPKYEIFKVMDGKLRFRLVEGEHIIFVSEQEFSSELDCRTAITLLKQDSFLAPTVFS